MAGIEFGQAGDGATGVADDGLDTLFAGLGIEVAEADARVAADRGSRVATAGTGRANRGKMKRYRSWGDS